MKPCAVVLAGITAFFAFPGGIVAEDSDARALLDTVVKSYQALDAYSDGGTFTITATIRGKQTTLATPMGLRLKRPNLVAVDAGNVRLFSDGKTLTTLIVPTKRFVSEPAPAKLGLAAIVEGPAGAMLLGGPGGAAANVVLQMLLGTDPAAGLLAGGTVAKLDPDREHNGKTVRVLRLDPLTGADVTLLIDPATKLIQRIEIADPNRAADPGVTAVGLVWDAVAVSTEAPKPEAFAATTPPGFTKVSELQAAKAKPAEPKHELIGQPAPEFTLDVLEAGGATRRVTKADLAGKVVLLDFWATWCGPCLRELPEIAALIEEYNQAGKPVVVLAASQDRKPKDGAVRALVESTMKEHKLDLVRPPVGLVALDPEMALGQAFKVEALPTVFLLDKKGVVQGVHIGAGDDIREVLRRDIDALLEGKPLDKAEAK